MIFVNVGGRIVYANPRCAEVMGYSVETLTSETFDFQSLIAPESLPRVRASFEQHQRGEEVGPIEYTLVTQEGTRLDAIHTTRLIRYGKKHAILGILTDVTERNRTLEALRDSHEHYRVLLDTCPDGIVTASRSGEVISANDCAAKILGLSCSAELVAQGKLFSERIVPGDREMARAALDRVVNSGGVACFDLGVARADGSVLPLEVHASAMAPDAATGERGKGTAEDAAIVAVFRDITTRRTAEEMRRRDEAEMARAQRLESLGVLAGGIAHDFNNILVGILGNASLARGSAGLSPQARKALERIEVAAERAADLTAQMLAYSGRDSLTLAPLHFADAVHQIAALLHVALPKEVRVEFACPPGLPTIDGDAGRLQQIVMNLISNAADAMQAGGGIVKLAVDSFHGDPNDEPDLVLARPPALANNGAWVTLEISDTGAGMTAATLSRIFEPFFSTKEEGRGLGLAATLGIVRSHSGALAVTSRPGVGTTFRVFLPVSPQHRGPPSAGRSLGGALPGSHVVVVADAEELVRDVVCGALESEGFIVVTADSYRQLREVLASQPQVDLLLIDGDLRGPTAEIASWIDQARAGAWPVITMTARADAHTPTANRVLAKPFSAAQIVAAVRAALPPARDRDG